MPIIKQKTVDYVKEYKKNCFIIGHLQDVTNCEVSHKALEINMLSHLCLFPGFILSKYLFAFCKMKFKNSWHGGSGRAKAD